MNVRAALISFTLAKHSKTYETSGVLFNQNFVLFNGTSLIPLMQQENWIATFVNFSSSKLEPNAYIQSLYFRVFIQHEKINENDLTSKGFYSFEGKAVGVWKCPLVSQSISRLFCDWTIAHSSNESKSRDLSADGTDLPKELMSIFILLKCESRKELEHNKEVNKSQDVIRELHNFIPSLQKAHRGQEVEVVSTPFGHRHFMNSVTRGVISNVVGCEKCIILSDARTVPGCEGGPIFAIKTSRKEKIVIGKLIGLVTCPLSWWRGEWVGFSLGVSLMPVIKRLLHLQKDITGFTGIFSGSLSFDSLPFKFVDESVVLIRSKSSWGSGVVLHGVSGTVITCSHVIKDAEVVSVIHMKKQYSADVIFKTQDDMAYDLAVVKIRYSYNYGFRKEVKFSEKPAKIGDPIIGAGFPFFSEEDDFGIRPSVVTGCIAQVNSHMIQTTCCIQAGFSGGALFRGEELLGIIVSNAVVSGALFPHINFGVPSSVFKEPILEYIRKNDARCLQGLKSSNVQIQSLWKLHPSKL